MLGTAVKLPVNGRNPKAVEMALKLGEIELVPFPAGLPLRRKQVKYIPPSWYSSSGIGKVVTLENTGNNLKGDPKYAHNPLGYPYALIVYKSQRKQNNNKPRNSAPPPMFQQQQPPPQPPKNNNRHRWHPPIERVETKEEKNKREAKEKAEANLEAQRREAAEKAAEVRIAERNRKQSVWNERMRKAHLTSQNRNKKIFSNLKIPNLNAKMRNINSGMAKIEEQYGKTDALIKRHAWFFTRKRFEPVTKEVEQLRKVYSNAKWAHKRLKELKNSSNNNAYRIGVRHLDKFNTSHAIIKSKSGNVSKTFQYYIRELPSLIARWEANEKKITNTKEREEARRRHAQAANAYLAKLNKEHANKKTAATKIQTAYKGVLARRALVQMKKARENAATKIQAAVRGVQARKTLTKTVKAVTRLQSMFRGGLARKRFANIKRLGVNEAKAKANVNAATRAANKAKEAAKEAEGKLRYGWQYLKWSNPEAYHDYMAHVRPFEVAMNQSRNRLFKTSGWMRNALPGLGVINQKLKDNYEAAFQKWYKQFFKKNTNQKAANLIANTHKNAIAAKEKANAAEVQRRRAVQEAVEAARAARQARVTPQRHLQFVHAR